MSRTNHHGGRSPKKRYIWLDELREPAPPKKKRHYIGPYHYWMHTPGWWTRQVMTRPQRATVRGLIAKLHRIQDLEDAPLFPLAKKPHIYYW